MAQDRDNEDDRPEVSERVIRTAYSKERGDGTLFPRQGQVLVALQVVAIVALFIYALRPPAYVGVIVAAAVIVPPYVVIGFLARKYACHGRVPPALVLLGTSWLAKGHAAFVSMGKAPRSDSVTEAMATPILGAAQFMLVIGWPVFVCLLLWWLLRRLQ